MFADAALPAVLAVIFLATVVRSAFGFGEALVAVPLLALVLRQDIDRLRQHNAKRGNTNTEQRVERDLVACEKLGAQTLEDDLTVGQVIPRLVEKFHNIAQHNSGAGDGIEQKLQQLTERAIDHLKQIAEVAK